MARALRVHLAATVVLILGWAAAAPAGATDPPFEIPVILSLTGPASPVGAGEGQTIPVLENAINKAERRLHRDRGVSESGRRGATDIAIIRMRKRMLESVRRFMDGKSPIGLDTDIRYDKLWAEQAVIPIDQPWQSIGPPETHASQPASV